MGNEQHLISVIIPVYNVEQYICRCVNSVIDQDYRNLEIILVNDGSADNSGQICDRLAEKDDRIIVIHKENGGLSSARNAGLDICRGEYISFVDSDDWIEQGMYTAMLSVMESQSVLLACCGRNDIIDGKKRVGLCHQIHEVIDSQEAIRRILSWENLDSSACDKLFHQSIWNVYRFPVGRLSEDVAIMYKIIDSVGKIALVATPFYNYYHRKGSITTSAFNPKMLGSIKNIDEMESFLEDKYAILTDDFCYFKYVVCSHLLTLLARDRSEQYKDIEKDLCTRLEACGSVHKRLNKKAKVKFFLQKKYAIYSQIFKPVLRLKDRIQRV